MMPPDRWNMFLLGMVTTVLIEIAIAIFYLGLFA